MMKSPLFGIDWKIRQDHPLRRGLNALERISLAFESLVNRLVRDERFNPFYHTGTISVFLLLIIVLTGVYISLFYQVGFEDSYRAVAAIEANPLGRVMRALHRYASAAALVTALLHGWRTFFMDRFRGPRWLAWLTGVGMAAIVWIAGVTGYWMIWDERAAVFNATLARVLASASSGVSFLLDFVYGPQAGSGWVFALILLTVHIGITLLLIVFFVYHIKRLSRPKWFPPRYWMIGLGGLLLAAAVLIPAGNLPPFQQNFLPAEFPADWFFLFYLPAALQQPPLLVWGVLILLVALAGLIPWLLRRPALPVIQVHAERCTGCTLCAEDCPYTALRMVERNDQSGHKFLAVLDPERCVSCGVCIGSCPTLALTLGDQPAEALWEGVVSSLASRSGEPVQVVFTCERHAQHGAAAMLQNPDLHTRIIPLTCIGMAHPDLAEKALAAGASEVRFIGCPPQDCANREGNLWLEQRLDRQRQPRLRQERASLPLFTTWLSPDRFRAGLVARTSIPPTAYPLTPIASGLSVRPAWPNFIPALILMGLVLTSQLFLTILPIRVLSPQSAHLEVVLQHRPGAPILIDRQPVSFAENNSDPLLLRVVVDGQIQVEARVPTSGTGPRAIQKDFEQITIPSGERQVQVVLEAPSAKQLAIFDGQLTLTPGQVIQITIQDARLKGDPFAGERLFTGAVQSKNTGCQICHSLEPGVVLVGPSLAGVASRAAARVPGMIAEDYLRQSIVEPDTFIVPDFPAGQMVPTYLQILSKEEIDDLVAFLLTLK